MLILQISALVSYLISEHAARDMYHKRTNACAVLAVCINAINNAPHKIQEAVEKCKGSVKNPVTRQVCKYTMTCKTLACLHDALAKCPPVSRPVDDTRDTCNLDAWNLERSFVREIFGTQLEDDTHPLVLEAPLNAYTVKRAPLVLVYGHPKQCLEHPRALTFAGIEYELLGVERRNETDVCTAIYVRAPTP